jgi:hypothetical protein
MRTPRPVTRRAGVTRRVPRATATHVSRRRYPRGARSASWRHVGPRCRAGHPGARPTCTPTPVRGRTSPRVAVEPRPSRCPTPRSRRRRSFTCANRRGRSSSHRRIWRSSRGADGRHVLGLANKLQLDLVSWTYRCRRRHRHHSAGPGADWRAEAHRTHGQVGVTLCDGVFCLGGLPLNSGGWRGVRRAGLVIGGPRSA